MHYSAYKQAIYYFRFHVDFITEWRGIKFNKCNYNKIGIDDQAKFVLSFLVNNFGHAIPGKYAWLSISKT